MIFPNLLKLVFLNEDDVPWKSYFFHLLQLFSLTHKFKVTQALLESKVYVCSHLGDEVTYWQAGRVGCQSLEEVGCWLIHQSLCKSHSEFLWDYYETDYDMTLNDGIYLLGVVESAMIWNTSKANLIKRTTSQVLNGHWQW